jgi:hypothetical protein
MNQKE